MSAAAGRSSSPGAHASAHEAVLFPPGPVAKLCGLTRLGDVVQACRLGAWAVGFIFAPSPRRLTPGEARTLLERAEQTVRRTGRGALAVGVFTDSTPEDISTVVRYIGLDAVQLHGPSAPDARLVRRALAGWRPPARLGGAELPEALVIRAVTLSPETDDVAEVAARLRAAQAEADLVLVDAGASGRVGGTGMVLPWRLLGEAAAGMRMLLAGGIRPDNAAEALAASGAWGIDVASGVERAPGVKDGAAVADLMTQLDDIRSSRTTGKIAMTGRTEI